jgi:tight adherence protein B
MFSSWFLIILGSLCCAGACTLVIAPWLQRVLVRHWVRNRLGIAHLVSNHPSTTPMHRALASVSEFLDAIARDVRSGYSLTAAFVQCSDRFPHLNAWTQPVTQHCLRGASLASAFAECNSLDWSPDMHQAARALSIASNGGPGVARVVEHSASVLREQHALREDAAAQTSHIRLSMQVLTWLPLVMCVWLAVSNDGARQFLVGSTAGWCCIAVGVSLNMTGRRWAQQLTHTSLA